VIASDCRPTRSRSLAAVLCCGLLVGCGGGTSDATPKQVTIDVAREHGRNAMASAEGIVSRPAAVAIRASAAPSQRVVVTWGLSCPRTPNGRDKGIGGTYATIAPNVRALRLPRREIAFCAVHGEARLSRSGRVKATLLGSRR
jgi:hypothetical protein